MNYNQGEVAELHLAI